MQAEHTPKAAVVLNGNVIQRQRGACSVQYRVIGSRNGVGVEPILETKLSYLPAIIGPMPLGNRLGLAHSALTPSFARL